MLFLENSVITWIIFSVAVIVVWRVVGFKVRAKATSSVFEAEQIIEKNGIFLLFELLFQPLRLQAHTTTSRLKCPGFPFAWYTMTLVLDRSWISILSLGFSVLFPSPLRHELGTHKFSSREKGIKRITSLGPWRTATGHWFNALLPCGKRRKGRGGQKMPVSSLGPAQTSTYDTDFRYLEES